MTADEAAADQSDKGVSGLDGPISRYLNRPISRRISARVARRSITADQWSWIAFATTLFGAAAFAFRLPRIGAACVHAGSILDGVDGEVARAQGTAGPSGALLDLVLDRTADVVLVGGLARGAGGNTADWVAALLAANGIVTASVAKERLSAEGVAAAATQRFEARSGWQRMLLPLGGRDGRLFALTSFGLARQPRLALWWLAGHSTLRLVERVRAGRALIAVRDEPVVASPPLTEDPGSRTPVANTPSSGRASSS